MKFLVDMPVSPEVARWLSGNGHDAIHVSDIGLFSASDKVIIEEARKQGRIVITADLDFPRILAQSKSVDPGIILFRGGNYSDSEMLGLLEWVLKNASEEKIRNSITLDDRMTLENDIALFCSFIEERLRDIRALEDRLFKKILLMAMFDTLSRAPFPKCGNRDRFLKLIEHCADWDEKNRVSLTQLSHSLNALEDKSGSALKNAVNERLVKDQASPSSDPAYAEIIAFAVSKEEKKCVENAKHAALLYTYRCNLIHEFREPGDGMEMSPGDKPFYHGMQHVQAGEESTELVYPLGFFFHIVESSLRNLKDYLLTHKINPRDSYSFGSHWR